MFWKINQFPQDSKSPFCELLTKYIITQALSWKPHVMILNSQHIIFKKWYNSMIKLYLVYQILKSVDIPKLLKSVMCLGSAALY